MSRFRIYSSLVFTLLLIGWMVAPTAADAQYFGKNKVQYREFDWRTYNAPHFTVYYYTEEEELLEKVVSFAESAYDHLSREFDFQITEPTPLIFYATHSAFEQNNIILNFIPEGTGAFASPVRNRMVLPVDLPDPELLELLLHELTHIFQYHILFQGRLGKGVASSLPTWYMEGMASYMAKDESARDRMYLRDAVVNDRIPSVTQDFGGFFAYRYGHAFFDFIEERWGKEGYLDFVVETRNTLGGRVDRAIQRTFNISGEDFDGEFRRWLRKRYLQELVETGEPGDFGRPFRVKGAGGQSTSAVAAPSGDLIGAFNTAKGEVDVVVFDTQTRTMVQNLTKGYNSSIFQYVVAQELTLGRQDGRDLSISPDGNTLVGFAKKESGRSLVLFDLVKNKIGKVVDTDVEQELAPAFSPDGRQVAFSGYRNGQFDIFTYDIETEEIGQLTDDGVYDRSVTYSPDGKSIIITSSVGGLSKLFRIDLDNLGVRHQLTLGDSNEFDPVYSIDGERVFFTSDRSGANNIFELHLGNGALRQHTNAVTGCFQPTVLASPTGKERLVYTAFWNGGFDLYMLDIEEPITEPIVVEKPGEEPFEPPVVAAGALPVFEPAIEVAIDEDNMGNYKGKKFFLENFSGSGIGISDDQTLIASIYLSFSDYLGDRRIIGSFSSISNFSNFDVYYLNLSKRLQWTAHLFDNRDFYLGLSQDRNQVERIQEAFSLTGATFGIIYPLSFYHRVEMDVGYYLRDLNFQTAVRDPETGEIIPIITPRSDNYPQVSSALVGDTTVFAGWGPVSGRRWRLRGSYAPDVEDTGPESALTSTVALDFRQYLPITRRSNIAFRAVGQYSDGNFPDPIYYGGIDTIRGYDFRSIVGDRGFMANLEYRFPIIDYMATPLGNFQGLRAFIFVDVGGAYFADFQEFDFWEDGRLKDGVASYGWGFSVRFFGLPWNFNFAKRTDFKTDLSGFQSSFWIGQKF